MSNSCYAFIVTEPKCVHGISAINNSNYEAKSLRPSKAQVSRIRLWTLQAARAAREHISSPRVSVRPLLRLRHLFSISQPSPACGRVRVTGFSEFETSPLTLSLSGAIIGLRE